MKALISAIVVGGMAAGVAGAAPRSEINMPAGSLGVAALDRGDYATAESQIVGLGQSEADPAKLINLGNVYIRTGRAKEAIATWQRAASLPNQYDVVTGSGDVKNTREVAMKAIERYRVAALAQ